jgi:PAS domain S-box-containing protein
LSTDAAASSHSVLELQQRVDELSSKLRESESRLVLVRDAVSEGIYEWNIETNDLWQSQRLAEIFGLASRELKLKAADWNELVHPEDFERYRSALRDCFKRIGGRLDCEYRVKHTDGSYRWLEDRAVPVRNAAGRAVRLVGAITDVTSRKESEQALREALDQQTATAEVLQIINASPSDLTPVFDAMLERATRLCDAPSGLMWTATGERFHPVAIHGMSAEFVEFVHDPNNQPRMIASDLPIGRVVRGEPVVHVLDLLADEGAHKLPTLQKLGGFRTVLALPLRNDAALLGAFVIGRREVRPFTERQIALLQNFAAQAVIAMENARLITETQDALERQTATAEVLQVINSSPGELRPVFETILKKAHALCQVEHGALQLYDGEKFRAVATHGLPESFANRVRQGYAPGPNLPVRRLLEGADLVQVPDLTEIDDPIARGAVQLVGLKTVLFVALRKDGNLLGMIVASRREVRPFSDKEISLLQNFADQAVIAMENARLLGELRQRTDDLTESLDYQTATSEVLGVISHSPTDLQPVLEAMTAAAVRLCGVKTGGLSVRRGESLHFVALVGQTPEFERWQMSAPIPVQRGVPLGDAILDKEPVQIVDVMETEAYKAGADVERAVVELGGHRTILHVPLLRDDEAIGVLTVSRGEPEAFTERQIGLIKTFADQAVIAMENARLLSELRESLDQQTATAEVLRVINTSPGELAPVFTAMLEKAMHLCDAAFGTLWVRDGDHMAMVGVPPAYQDFLDKHPISYGENWGAKGTIPNRIMAGAPEIHVEDLAAEAPYLEGDLHRRAMVDIGGARSALAVPLVKDGAAIGYILIYRQEVRRFDNKQATLLKNFAAQAVIAVENARLLGELRESLEQQTATGEVLKVISESPTDVDPVLDAVAKAALRFCGATDVVIALRDGEEILPAAHQGPLPDVEANLQLDRGSVTGRSMIDAATIHIPDAAALDPNEYTAAMELSHRHGWRAAVAAPMLREGVGSGAILLRKTEPGPFTPRQVGLLETFAAQAVIAIENVRLFTELRESLEQQTATGDVLKIISRSSVSLETVLDTLVETVARLCRADQAYMFRRQEGLNHLLASHGVSDAAREYIVHPFASDRGSASGRALLERRTIHIADVLADPEYTYAEGQKVGGWRTGLAIPLMREEAIVGVFVLTRTRVDPFSDKEIELATSFADQAVIAIENARLFEELRDREAELRVTFDNMGDGVAMFDGEPRLAAWNRNFETIIGLPEARLAERPSYADYLRLLAERGEFGTDNVEADLASRLENTDRELRLERTRADGTVIEVRRNAVPGGGFVLIYSDVTERRRAEAAIRAARDAAEAALERQTATADILKVIASSPTDVQPVLQAVAKAAVRFCGAIDANIHMRDGDEVVNAAHEGPLRAGSRRRRPLNRQTAFGTAMLERRTVQFPDIEALDPVEFASARQLAAEFGFRSVLAAPFLREGTAIGTITLRRTEPGAFTQQQIELLETFAAQAVIAIENVRLFTELKESLEQQTATSEILRAISQSPTDVTPVLNAVAKAAVRFCGAEDSTISLRDGAELTLAAHEGPIGSEEVGRRYPLDGATVRGQSIIDGRTIHVVDATGPEGAPYERTQELAKRLGFHTVLAAPMLREEEAIGSIALRKSQPDAFTPRQIELLETFAAQAVIAIENVRLFTELRDSLERLKAAQANLIQSEKMASLGQLTAGIAHEIKNPLNFVNNFAGLSVELLDELKEIAGPVLAGMSENARAEFGETIEMITGNLEKIAEHGKRADGIVKSMLSHSRGGTGDWQETNINTLVEEALNLAYHGARAQDKEFNVTLERDFAPEARPIEVVPQDVTRVFLNLFSNGFYAATKRRRGGANSGYEPTLRVSTRDLGEVVEIRVRDNGVGIPREVRDKLFQPFFTTKPTGEGTGLGLSISYDIVTQQHGGTIDVESEPGSFTEFTIRLPRGRRVTQPGGA